MENIVPDFVCVGPGRSGTTWLYEVLLAHPEIELAKDIKETEFFNTYFDKGPSWYANFFRDAIPKAKTGEVSNTYIFNRQVPERIAQFNPDCKIIICIRNPVQRIQSVYGFRIRTGLIKESFEGIIEKQPEFLEHGKIDHLIQDYIKTFGKKNIFFVDFEKIKNNPKDLCQKLFSFLGVDAAFYPQKADEKVNKAIQPRLWIIGRFARKLAYFLRRHEFFHTLTSLKRSEFLKNIFFKDLDKNKLEITPENEKFLREYYQKEWSLLHKYIS